MENLDTERRSERATTRSGATFLLLDSLVDKGSVQAVALTNGSGFLVASTRGRFDGERLARAGLGGEPMDDVDIFAHPMRIHGKPFLLVSAGGRVPRVREVSAALGRILPPRS